MVEDITSFLHLFNLIGKNPHLFIFSKYRNKSILSSIISIIIILCSIAFSIYSILDYLKFKNPNISFSKGNDEETNRNFFKKDFLLMFQLIDTTSLKPLNNSIGYYLGEFIIYYNNGTNIYTRLDIETCEIGKNIDKKYENFVNDKSNYGRKIEDFYCINSEFENISLFYDPKVGFSTITLYIIFQNNTIYTPEKIQSLITTENNIINNFDRNNPINKGYMFQITSAYSSIEYTRVNYNFQYLQYESDEGFLFPKTRTLYGMSFSDITSYRNKQDINNVTQRFGEIKNSIIGTIEFAINKSTFDNYKRIYQRLQSLLAEIMSVISLLFEIGRQLSNFLGDKQMSLNIIEYLINKNEAQSKKNRRKLIVIKNKSKESSIKKISSEILDKSNNLHNSINNNEIKLNSNNNKLLKKGKINNVDEKNKILKEINYFHIIKSFFCFKDKNIQFIIFCNNIIKQDMSVERILERFYIMENIHHYFSNEEKGNLRQIKSKRSFEIDKKLDDFFDEIKKKNNLKIKNK